MTRKKQNSTGEAPIPEAARPAYEAVVGRIDAFCREHLNEEYRVLCRRLAGFQAMFLVAWERATPRGMRCTRSTKNSDRRSEED